MKIITYRVIFSVLLFFLFFYSGWCQKNDLKTVYAVYTTGCKNQAYSSTCWCFATVSFIESELYRLQQESYDLSEMYFVRCIYPAKAQTYLRWHGNVFFTPGGQPHDVMNVIRSHGFVPENVYKGSTGEQTFPDHSELDTLMRSVTITAQQNENACVSGSWLNSIELMLDNYLGPKPSTFVHSGKTLTPLEFASLTGFNPDDYVEITSYNHHPYYSSFILETKYNWSHDRYFNIPFDEFSELFEVALKAGYSIVYNGDVSENEFSYEYGMAVLPEKRWATKTDTEKENTFSGTEREIIPDAATRQKMFDDGSTTVDHVMHIKGLAKDAAGKKYYVVKNSWGDPAANGGLIYMSESYLLLKCVSVMVHKNALKPVIRKKLGLE